MALAEHPFPSSCFHFAPVSVPPLPHTEALVWGGGAEPTPSSQNYPPPVQWACDSILANEMQEQIFWAGLLGEVS